ncbi:MAG: hypothetical protein V4550_16140 [Gemmatimonadota bacterium]
MSSVETNDGHLPVTADRTRELRAHLRRGGRWTTLARFAAQFSLATEPEGDVRGPHSVRDTLEHPGEDIRGGIARRERCGDLGYRVEQRTVITAESRESRGGSGNSRVGIARRNSWQVKLLPIGDATT